MSHNALYQPHEVSALPHKVSALTHDVSALLHRVSALLHNVNTERDLLRMRSSKICCVFAGLNPKP